MLSATGNARTSDISSARGDVLLADSLLDTVDREVQSRGWHFTREFNITLSPDGDGFIFIPTDIVRISEAPIHLRTTNKALTNPVNEADLIKMGNRLYNRTDRDFTFDSDVTLHWERRRDFDDLPEAARIYITARASRKFYFRLRGSDSRDLGEDEARTHATLIQEEHRIDRQNAFRNPDVSQAIRGRGRLPRG